MTLKWFITLVAVITAQVTVTAQSDPELEFVLELHVDIGQAATVGPTGHGQRNIVPITGGSFSGPLIKGEILAGGADYQLIDNTNNRSKLEAIYCLRTDDGETVYVRNVGIATKNYFFTSPRFEASTNGRYAWLNDGIYVCRPSGFSKNSISLKVWKVRESTDLTTSITNIPPLPETINQPAVKRGTVETFYYTVSQNQTSIRKRAQVYLPHGYRPKDTEKRYNVIYLIHGGGDNTSSFFSDPRSPLPLTQVLDHLIADGKMEPVIVVTPTFYNDDTNIGANRMDDAIALTRNFHIELQNFLIPAVEKAYNTYLEEADKDHIVATREHRAFGGFSMGALATWFQLAYGVETVKHFIPLSGDLWFFDSEGEKQPAQVAASWLGARIEASSYADDFAVYACSGTEDIAGEPEKALVKALAKETSVFRYAAENANLFMSMKKGGKHYYGDINEYLYFILPRIWNKNRH